MSSLEPSAGDPAEYRLAPLLVARFVGVYLLFLAVVVVVATVLVTVSGGPLDLIVVLLLVGVVVLFLGAGWLRSRAYIVRLDDQGYVVRLVRGAGVKRGRWSDVVEAVAAHPHDIPCLVLRLHDGRTTTVPVEAMAADRDQFARDVRDRLAASARRGS